MIRINLAPTGTSATRTRTGQVVLACGGVTAALLLGLGGWHTSLRRDEARLTDEVAILGREVTALQPVHGAEARARQAALDLARREHAIQGLAQGQEAMVRALAGLLDAVPPDVSLTAVDGRGADLRAAGLAGSARAVADFAATLRASGFFRDAEIVLSRRDLGKVPAGPLSFEITCRIGS